MDAAAENKQGDRMLSHRVLVFRSALVAGLSLFSGTASALDFGVGPLFGVNLANASIDEPQGTSLKTEMNTGFAFGARAEFGVTSPYSLLLEPQYLQRGASEKFSGLGVSAQADVRLNYLELPILAKAKFGSMKAHAYAFAGPSLGLFLNGEAESGGGTNDVKNISSFNFSADIGAGGTYQAQEYVYVNADVRYSHGFTSASDTSDDNDWLNRDIRIQLCVLFHLTK
jgi:opacity protein-like surface antigen